MEELQVIETTSGRQFKPWASKEDVQAIGQAVEQAVQDPASVTAIASEIASGKQAIASAINAKGGEASATESFTELAQDIQDTPTSGVLSRGIVQSEPFSFLDYVCKQGAYPFSEIDDDSVTIIDKSNAFTKQNFLESVKMTALITISGMSTFQENSSLRQVNFPNLRTISGSSVFRSCPSLLEINLPNLEILLGEYIITSSAVDRFIAPKLNTLALGCFSFTNVKTMILGTLVTCTQPFYQGGMTSLRSLTIGQDTDINLQFEGWKATNVIAEGQSGIDELNSNLYNNLLTKLYDHSQDGQTRTLRIGWLSRVTAENIAYANAKGWTLTT